MKTSVVSEITPRESIHNSTPPSHDVRGGSTSGWASRHRRAASFMCGTIIPGLKINGQPAPYPVVNERAVRATAGLMLITAALAFSQAFFLKNFLPLKIVTPLFFVDFTLRVLTGMTSLSPFGILGSLLVRNQRPEWAGAMQKRFAWSIGIAVALLMTIITNMNITGLLPLSFCVEPVEKAPKPHKS